MTDREELIKRFQTGFVMHGTSAGGPMQIAAFPEELADAVIALGFTRPDTTTESVDPEPITSYQATDGRSTIPMDINDEPFVRQVRGWPSWRIETRRSWSTPWTPVDSEARL